MDDLNVSKITADVITNLAKTVSEDAWKKIKKVYKDVKEKGAITLGTAFEEYLDASQERYSKIKTLLYKQEPKYLYDFYETIGLTNGRIKIDTENVNKVIAIGHKLIVCGTGGVGKSTMLKHFFLNAIKTSQMIPVLIELRNINDKEDKDIDIIEEIYATITNHRFNLEKEYFIYSLEMGCYLILLDGYDEVKPGKAEKLFRQISTLCNKYPDNYYIVSSRPSEDFIGWNNFTELKSLTLTKTQALSLINKLDYDVDIKSSFYKALNETLYDKYESFASNPLLLTIMLLTFENRASIPDKLNDFYEQAFSALFNVHDATKGAYKRDIRCNLGYEDFKSVFSYICFKSYFANDYKFTESSILRYIDSAQSKLKLEKSFDNEDYKQDLVKSVCMLVHEGLDYLFAHRSFQEYFAALYTTKLPDDIQERLLAGWLKESSSYRTDSYLGMLDALQHERFERNVLYPGAMKIRKYFEQNGLSYEKLFRELFTGVYAIKIRRSKKQNCRIILRVRNSYFCSVLEIFGNIYDLGNADICDSEVGRTRQDVIAKTLIDKYGESKNISIKTLETDGLYNDMLEVVRWHILRYNCLIRFLEQYENNVIGSKRKLQSILSEL